MGVHTERWTRADEEMKYYDNQLTYIKTSPVFLGLIKGTARAISDPKTQLFLNQDQKKIRRSRRNGV